MSDGEPAREAGSGQAFEKIAKLKFAASQPVTICHDIKGGIDDEEA